MTHSQRVSITLVIQGSRPLTPGIISLSDLLERPPCSAARAQPFHPVEEDFIPFETPHNRC
jgi:hypothetical protein